MTQRWKTALKQLAAYKSALLGIGILTFMVAVSIYTVVTIPYEEAIRLWRLGEDISLDNPRYAQPSWVNYFASKKLPETIILDSHEKRVGVTKVIVSGEHISIVRIEFSFNYDYYDFHREMNLFFDAE